MMKLTKKKAIELHRRVLWDWLYHHPSKNKEDCPRWEFNGGDIPRVSIDCFLCEVSDSCEDCPVEWPGGDGCMSTSDHKAGVFKKWLHAKSPHTKKKYAKIIRDLPERK